MKYWKKLSSKRVVAKAYSRIKDSVLKYKIEQAMNEDELSDEYKILLFKNGFCVDEKNRINISTIEELNRLIKLLDGVNGFESYLGYKGIIVHENVIIIRDSFIY